MSSSLENDTCPTCFKVLRKASIRKHRIEVHGEKIYPKIQVARIEKLDTPLTANSILPQRVYETNPVKVLLNKIEGCAHHYNGTKEAMQLYFSFEECNLILECVRECLKKNEAVQINETA